jgi:Peptidase family M28
MTRFLKNISPLVFGLLMACNSCETETKNGGKTTVSAVETYQKPAVQLSVPAFSQDSAFKFIEKQLSFGPRVPNSAAAANCQKYFVSELKRLGAKVTEQSFSAKRYDGVDLKGTNIIAQYRPENKRRILLAAHWDSRFMSDQDPKDKTSGVPAADDGASGVGILMEIGFCKKILRTSVSTSFFGMRKIKVRSKMPNHGASVHNIGSKINISLARFSASTSIWLAQRVRGFRKSAIRWFMLQKWSKRRGHWPMRWVLSNISCKILAALSRMTMRWPRKSAKFQRLISSICRRDNGRSARIGTHKATCFQ